MHGVGIGGFCWLAGGRWMGCGALERERSRCWMVGIDESLIFLSRGGFGRGGSSWWEGKFGLGWM